MLENFSPAARAVMDAAQEKAVLYRSPYVEPVFILLELTNPTKPYAQILTALGISLDALRYQLINMVPDSDRPAPARPAFSRRTQRIMDYAMSEARNEDCRQVDVRHIVLAIVRENEDRASRLLNEFIAVPRRGQQLEKARGILQTLAA